MGIMDGYQPDDSYGGIKDGNHRVKIVSVNEGTSKNSGLPMLTVEMSIQNASFTVKAYIVKNEHFNGNMTKFFDCFGIPRGDTNTPGWIGKYGVAKLAKGDSGYMEFKCFVIGDKDKTNDDNEAAHQEHMERQSESDETFADDIPF